MSSSLPDDINALKRLLAEQEALNHALLEKLNEREREIDHLQAQLDKLRRMNFGSRSEKVSRRIAQMEADLKALQKESDTLTGRVDDPAVRVALARALIHRPGLLLLDEPLGALDALTRLEMQDLIVSLWQEHGFTVLLVTHDVSEAVAMADRVLLIEEGKIGLDLTVDIPRPRRLGSVRLAELEAEVLQRVMQRGHSEQPIRRHG